MRASFAPRLGWPDVVSGRLSTFCSVLEVWRGRGSDGRPERRGGIASGSLDLEDSRAAATGGRASGPSVADAGSSGALDCALCGWAGGAELKPGGDKVDLRHAQKVPPEISRARAAPSRTRPRERSGLVAGIVVASLRRERDPGAAGGLTDSTSSTNASANV
jgi:hypothetical protein